MRSLSMLARLLLLIGLAPVLIIWHGCKKWWQIFSRESEYTT